MVLKNKAGYSPFVWLVEGASRTFLALHYSEQTMRHSALGLIGITGWNWIVGLSQRTHFS
jgi:hypothetical protein